MQAISLPRLVLRADGNATLGLGHVMRLLALAAMLREAFVECLFVGPDAPGLTPLLTESGLQVVASPAGLAPVAEAAWLCRQLLRPTDVLVLDGYHFGQSYQQTVRAAVGRLVYVDDLHAWPVEADVLINHSPGIIPGLYHRQHATTRLLLGPAFTLLRPALLAAAAPPRLPGPMQNVLVCFGGADPLQLTARCLPLLLSQPGIHSVGLLLGPANPAASQLKRLAAAAGGQVVLHGPVTALQLAGLLRSYDCLVGPASTILIEALIAGCPAITGYYAENQRHLAGYVAAHRQAYSVGDFTTLTDRQLKTQLATGLQWLSQASRTPYVNQLRPDLLRAAIAAPLPGALPQGAT